MDIRLAQKMAYEVTAVMNLQVSQTQLISSLLADLTVKFSHNTLSTPRRHPYCRPTNQKFM